MNSEYDPTYMGIPPPLLPPPASLAEQWRRIRRDIPPEIEPGWVAHLEAVYWSGASTALHLLGAHHDHVLGEVEAYCSRRHTADA